MTLQFAEHSWAWEILSDEAASLVVLDPVLDADGEDHTRWPSDEEISDAVGQPVVFSDRGDIPQEAIFNI